MPSTNNRYITTNHKFYDKENSEQVPGKINPRLITTSANSKLGGKEKKMKEITILEQKFHKNCFKNVPYAGPRSKGRRLFRS